MWYHRDFKDKIRTLAKHFPVVVLTGARQTGKTSILTELFPSHTYVSLDIPSLAQEAEADPQSFFARFPAPLLVDEVQYAPKLFRHLKSLIDSDRHKMGQYILTGSQKFVLMKEVSDSLAGRSVVLDLETLSLHELCQKPDMKVSVDSLAKIITRGTFPELWRNEEAPSEAFYQSYLVTYLERDVRQILNVTSLRDFERFIRACASRNAQLLDQTALAADVGVSLKAIKSWLSVLQASNQVVLLEPWFANFGKRLVKTPKLYFCDTGLVSYLLGINQDNFASSPFVGSLWETLVFSELRKLSSVAQKGNSIWFYRDQQQVEVDFMVLGGGLARLIECKWRSEVDMRDFVALEKIRRSATEKANPEFSQTKLSVVCRVEGKTSLGDGRYALPITELASLF